MSKNQTKANAPKPQPVKTDAATAAKAETATATAAATYAPVGGPPAAPVAPVAPVPPVAPVAPIAKAIRKRAAIADRVMLKVSAKQPQRYRAGIAFSKDARCVAVSEAAAAAIIADPMLSVSTDLTDEEIAELAKAEAAKDAAAADDGDDDE